MSYATAGHLVVDGVHLGQHDAVDGVRLARTRRQVRQPGLVEEKGQSALIEAVSDCSIAEAFAADDGARLAWPCCQVRQPRLEGKPQIVSKATTQDFNIAKACIAVNGVQLAGPRRRVRQPGLQR